MDGVKEVLGSSGMTAGLRDIAPKIGRNGDPGVCVGD